MAPGLLQKQQKQAENPGQWALSRHHHVSSIYTFNYSFSFQHFCIWNLPHPKIYFKTPQTAPSPSADLYRRFLL